MKLIFQFKPIHCQYNPLKRAKHWLVVFSHAPASGWTLNEYRYVTKKL